MPGNSANNTTALWPSSCLDSQPRPVSLSSFMSTYAVWQLHETKAKKNSLSTSSSALLEDLNLGGIAGKWRWLPKCRTWQGHTGSTWNSKECLSLQTAFTSVLNTRRLGGFSLLQRSLLSGHPAPVEWADGSFFHVPHWGIPLWFVPAKQGKRSFQHKTWHCVREQLPLSQQPILWRQSCDCATLQGTCSLPLSPRICSWSSPPPLLCQYWHEYSCTEYPRRWAETHPWYTVPLCAALCAQMRDALSHVRCSLQSYPGEALHQIGRWQSCAPMFSSWSPWVIWWVEVDS